MKTLIAGGAVGGMSRFLYLLMVGIEVEISGPTKLRIGVGSLEQSPHHTGNLDTSLLDRMEARSKLSMHVAKQPRCDAERTFKSLG